MDETSQQTPNSSRKIIILAIGAVLLLLGLGIYMTLGKSMNKQQPSVAVEKPTPTSATLFTSIQDALAKSLSLECTYEENGKKTIAYLKGGAVRANMTGGTSVENGSVIVKDNMMSFWNGKQGITMRFDMKAMKEQMMQASPAAQASPANPNANILGTLEEYKDACKPATVSDELFTPPADVKFVDQTKVMEDAQKMMRVTTPGTGMNQQEMQRTIQQYQPSPTVSN